MREGQGVVLMCTPPPHSPGNGSFPFTKLQHKSMSQFYKKSHHHAFQVMSSQHKTGAQILRVYVFLDHEKLSEMSVANYLR